MGDLWIESDFSIFKNLLNILKPITFDGEALSRRDINLLTADVIVNTLCKQIALIHIPLGQRRYEALTNKQEPTYVLLSNI